MEQVISRVFMDIPVQNRAYEAWATKAEANGFRAIGLADDMVALPLRADHPKGFLQPRRWRYTMRRWR